MKNVYKYKFAKLFFIIGTILAILIFFSSPSLIDYGKRIIIFTFIFCSIGWVIDRFRFKKPLIPLILIIVYLLVAGFYLHQETSKINCLMCNFAPYENIFTGTCHTICDICGHNPPWYLKKSNTCIPDIPFHKY